MAARDNNPIAPMGMGLLAPSALRQPAPEPMPLPEAIDVEITIDAPEGMGVIDPETGAAQIELEDGGVLIDLKPDISGRDPGGAARHGANLAEYVSTDELARISEDLLRGVQNDDESRKEWLDNRAQGIRLLGLTLESPQSAGADASTAVAGQSTVRHPMLLEATLRFQANARGELLPAEGPVKVSDTTTETGESDKRAESLQDDLNYYLTTVATEYYPDTDRLLLYVGFGGCGFKKVYFCPIRRRPVSESVDAQDLIVSNGATDMRNSARVTHVIHMRPSTLKRMQLAGSYRDVSTGTPNQSETNPVDQQIADTQGISAQNQLPEDREHTIYEVYCELDIRGFEDKRDGKETGLALPYRVAIDKDSRAILEIRRNWAEDDERKLAKVPLVKYPFVPGLGFYDIGLNHILGNTTNALTASWRLMLDAGMFANFPGFLYSKGFGRQNTNEFRVPPGGGVGLDTNNLPINQVVMPLPYKTPDAGFVAFVKDIADTGQRIGGTAEIQVGEGTQNAPVGTTLALIEQATKVEGAVHKRLHAAQAEEFQLLKECFRDNPESFIRSVKRKGAFEWDEETFVAALNDASVVPMADPNTPSHMHRLMKAMGMVQLDKAYPGVFDSKEVAIEAARMLRINDVDRLLNKAPQQGTNPEMMLKLKELEQKMAEMQQKPQLLAAKVAADGKDLQAKATMQANESADQAAERQSRERLGEMRIQEAMIDAQSDAAGRQADVEAARIEAKKPERADA